MSSTLQQYRQPVVTATGIFLGFMLDFVNRWLPNSFTTQSARDVVVAVGSLSSIAILIVVLFRILRMKQVADEKTYYNTTLKLFILGISVPFFSMVIIIFQKLTNFF